MALSKYMRPRGQRMEQRNIAGRFRGGKLTPVKAVAVRESESGSLTQSVTFELDPIAGRMLTPITGEVICVGVPVRSMLELKDPEVSGVWSDELVREKLLSGENLFALEEEGEISKRCGVSPRSVAGEKLVSSSIRLAHNAAVNHLRMRKYVKATQVAANSTAITPALLSQTVLDRLNAVLDPEDRVDGKVNFEMGSVMMPLSGEAPLKDIYANKSPGAHAGSGAESGRTTIDVDSNDAPGGSYTSLKARSDSATDRSPWTVPQANLENVFVDFEGYDAGSISLSDFYTAEMMDRLTREMRQLVDDNPIYGEELVARFAHGLSVDMGNQPVVLYQKEQVFGMIPERATDGPSLGDVQTNSVTQINFTVPIPPTEFGMVIITFACVKPDETLEHQPHPILSAEWGARNYVADEMALDPVPVTVRDLYSDADQADEETVVCYTGNNHLLRRYINYGFNRHLDKTTVENKTALWQIRVPMSVTPDSVIYPEDLDHYPFADQTAEICTYNIQTRARIATPIIFGPTPVEELAAIEDADIFEDAPEP